uniref:hypothetical protein n=1 Tax=Paenibacillus xylanexedens TaxID=528191 RepID=UPI0016426AC9
GNDNEYRFIDENNSTTKIVEEEDGRIKVYVNGVVDDFGKRDLEGEIVVYRKYKNEGEKRV